MKKSSSWVSSRFDPHLPLLRQHDVRRVRGGDVLDAAVAERRHVEAREQVLPGAEQDRADREVHLVDESGL